MKIIDYFVVAFYGLLGFIVIALIFCFAMQTHRIDVEMIKRHEAEVFDFGKNARLSGASSEANPYTNSYNRTKWLEGWMAAGK
jgi:ribosome modulation factor